MEKVKKMQNQYSVANIAMLSTWKKTCIIILSSIFTLMLGYFIGVKQPAATLEKNYFVQKNLLQTQQQQKNQLAQLQKTSLLHHQPTATTSAWTIQQLLSAFSNFDQINFKSIKPLPSIEQNNVLLTPVQIDAFASYQQLLLFLKVMMRTPYFFSLTSLVIEKQQNASLQMMATINLSGVSRNP